MRYASGVAPDVFLTWAQYKPQFVENGMLLDVTERINQSSVMSLDKFFPVIEDNISYQGRLWGMPWGFNSTVWMVNLDLLNEAGVGFPGYDWTVEDLRDISRKVANPQKKVFGTTNPIATAGGFMIQWVMKLGRARLSGREWAQCHRQLPRGGRNGGLLAGVGS